ncbi:hypothetical protein GE118_02640 [Mycoplasma sp. NEAQ87857]|uniref:hypothetical protein n=1 Tax=Mycoplasma sp. NEAQ87857 TaxID=2683967 RepID=UPI001315F33B|nr:hypothetical protein [Mycoplasma sp. NEAQ87857]QGZ97692.1 hypothetical protein GE118_02640 [Mycoplasma sp. NEAQ87857]
MKLKKWLLLSLTSPIIPLVATSCINETNLDNKTKEQKVFLNSIQGLVQIYKNNNEPEYAKYLEQELINARTKLSKNKNTNIMNDFDDVLNKIKESSEQNISIKQLEQNQIDARLQPLSNEISLDYKNSKNISFNDAKTNNLQISLNDPRFEVVNVVITKNHLGFSISYQILDTAKNEYSSVLTKQFNKDNFAYDFSQILSQIQPSYKNILNTTFKDAVNQDVIFNVIQPNFEIANLSVVKNVNNFVITYQVRKIDTNELSSVQTKYLSSNLFKKEVKEVQKETNSDTDSTNNTNSDKDNNNGLDNNSTTESNQNNLDNEKENDKDQESNPTDDQKETETIDQNTTENKDNQSNNNDQTPNTNDSAVDNKDQESNANQNGIESNNDQSTNDNQNNKDQTLNTNDSNTNNNQVDNSADNADNDKKDVDDHQSQPSTDINNNVDANNTPDSNSDSANKDTSNQDQSNNDENQSNASTDETANQANDNEYNQLLSQLEEADTKLKKIKSLAPYAFNGRQNTYDTFLALLEEVKNNKNLYSSKKDEWNRKLNNSLTSLKATANFVPGANWDNILSFADPSEQFNKLKEFINKYDQLDDLIINTEIKTSIQTAKNTLETQIAPYKNLPASALGSLNPVFNTLILANTNTYNGLKKSVDDNLAETNKFKEIREEANKELETYQYPYASFNFGNDQKAANDHIFEVFANSIKNWSFGEYFPATDSNPSYNEALAAKNEWGPTIEKYKALIKQEVDKGKGEYDANKLAHIDYDTNDTASLMALIKFNDAYTESQIAKLNKFRGILKLPILIDLSKSLTNDQKGALVIQNLLGYTRGIYIKDKIKVGEGDEESKKVLSTGHSYSTSTKKVADELGYLYNENYYGSYNQPIFAPSSIGVTADFISNIFMTKILGERNDYKNNGGIDADGFGHLLNSMDNHNIAFYGAVFIEDEGHDNVATTRNRYRISIQDMMWKINNNHKPFTNINES